MIRKPDFEYYPEEESAELITLDKAKEKFSVPEQNHDAVIVQAVTFLSNLKKYAKQKSMKPSTVYVIMTQKQLAVSLKEANQIIEGLLEIIEKDQK